jgi:hypothetical protein
MKDDKRTQLFMDYHAEMKLECKRHDEAVKLIDLRFGRRLECLAKEEHGGEGTTSGTMDDSMDDVSSRDDTSANPCSDNPETERLIKWSEERGE